MDSAGAHALVARLLDGFNGGDMALVESCLHPDAAAEFPFAPSPMPNTVQGREAVMAMFRQGRESFNTMKITATGFYWCADAFALIMEATSEAELVGGAPYSNRYIFVIGVQEERVILWREYFNSLTIAEAMSAQAEAL